MAKQTTTIHQHMNTETAAQFDKGSNAPVGTPFLKPRNVEAEGIAADPTDQRKVPGTHAKAAALTKKQRRAQSRARVQRYRAHAKAVSVDVTCISQIDGLRVFVAATLGHETAARPDVVSYAVSLLHNIATKAGNEVPNVGGNAAAHTVVAPMFNPGNQATPPLGTQAITPAPPQPLPIAQIPSSVFSGGEIWTDDLRVIVQFKDKDPRKDWLKTRGYCRPPDSYEWGRSMPDQKSAQAEFEVVLKYLVDAAIRSKSMLPQPALNV
jgi:hypothetical protein